MYLEDQTLSVHPEVYQACQSQWYRFQSCMMICFWQNTFWDKTSLSSLYLEGQTPLTLEVFRHANHNGTSFKAVWWSVSDKTHFGLKHQLSFVFRGPKFSTPWGFQACQSQWYKFQSCMMICYWQNTFWDKTSLLFVFRRAKLHAPWGFQACQSQCYKFQSCMMICFWQNTFWDKTSLLLCI